MGLAPGTRLGPYEITGSLGAGGMGEVYRARDTKLDRDVAIKILSDVFATDADRLARFEREAKTLAALNHPNIAHIHGLEESPSTGSGQAGVRALVMELVEGEDLAQRLTRGAIPIDEALLIARQIAEALDAAHEQGIVHRDLKPANIKVRVDGTVKVLDFGLAKLITPDLKVRPTGGLDAYSPTVVGPTFRSGVDGAGTQMGVILGTAAYMAPEQAKGKIVDKRADIWAFGIVLYEMLTGRAAYAGETITDVIAAVVTRDPDWTALPAGTPASTRRLLERCLEKDPKRRLRDIGEARLALEAMGTDSVRAVMTPASSVHRPTPFGPVHILASVLALALVAATIALVLMWRSGRAGEPLVTRTAVTLPQGLSLNLATRPPLAISRDGTKIVIAARRKGEDQLYLRLIGEFELRPLSGTEGASNPFFSPDGAWIAFFANGKLKKVRADGGPVVALADVADPRGGVWVTAETIVYSPDAAVPLHQIPAAGGPSRPIAPLDDAKRERTHRWPAALPDGKTILMTVGNDQQSNEYDDASIEAMRIDTGARIPLAKGRMARYVATGHLLYVRGPLVYAMPFDAVRLQARGTSVVVADGISGDATTGAAHFDVAEAGTFVFVPGDSSGAFRVLAWVDKSGTVTPIDAPAAHYGDPQVSPDGRRVAVSIIDRTGGRDIWVVDAALGTSMKLTFGGTNKTAHWSRDGKTLYYISYDPVRKLSAVMSLSSAGGGTPERLREIPGQVFVEDVSPDNKFLSMQVLGTVVRGGVADYTSVVRMSLTGGSMSEMVSSRGAWWSQISPDGRWLAHVGQVANGPDEVFVQSIATGARVAQISMKGGVEPRWSPDGRTIYYLQDDQLISVPVESTATLSVGKPVALLTGVPVWSTDSGQTYHVAPAGDRFLMMRPADERAAAPELRTVFNWFADLRRTMSGR